MLLQHGQRVVYLPGIAVNRASAGYRGEGKTDLLTELIGRVLPVVGAVSLRGG